VQACRYPGLGLGCRGSLRTGLSCGSGDPAWTASTSRASRARISLWSGRSFAAGFALGTRRPLLSRRA
ncbi:MAG: hypothetical protein OXS35_05740, partial [Dehalococcoidia bacterium]|nr:hypothetical protein [Dehalococcoidia bacterium]